ncbi:hypothetical protein ELUMI_v1c05170 [Williamsoniiplasma luminosum]|uniref:Uncharacterized protein n=1 Tax=Williamsoniiplasma luminosum TaxID=214888 RepID=A0A2K8NWX3_9MOLU|nr:hypothetical protein [Williamsoniiplasma luminosum]ATZ17241.1 hypothetical protein ELUMI_v1c05170 [Williamsoniiplasma luminosum]
MEKKLNKTKTISQEKKKMNNKKFYIDPFVNLEFKKYNSIFKNKKYNQLTDEFINFKTEYEKNYKWKRGLYYFLGLCLLTMLAFFIFSTFVWIVVLGAIAGIAHETHDIDLINIDPEMLSIVSTHFLISTTLFFLIPILCIILFWINKKWPAKDNYKSYWNLFIKSSLKSNEFKEKFIFNDKDVSLMLNGSKTTEKKESINKELQQHD